MNNFSSELTHEVFLYLTKNSLPTYLLVCRYWYSIILSMLYRTVVIKSAHILNLFYRTIISTHPTSCINSIVNHVRLIDDDSRQEYVRKAMVSALFTQLPNLLPNIKTTILHYRGHRWFNSANSEPVDYMNRVIHSNKFEYINDMVHELGNLKGIQLAVYDNTLCQGCDEMLDYLGFFPHLEELNVKYHITPTSTIKLFVQLLRQCPRLTYLTYGPGLTADNLFHNIEPRKYQSMRFFEVEISQLSIQHIKYITDTFVNLISLRLRIKQSTYNRALVNSILRISNRSDLNLDIHDFDMDGIMNTLYDFWVFINTSATTRNTQKRARIIYSASSDTMSSTRLLLGGSSRCLLMTCDFHIYYTQSSFFKYFEYCGHMICILIIEGWPLPINVNALSRTFPNLKELALVGSLLDHDDCILPLDNSHIRILTLNSICIHQLLLDYLSRVFPDLSTLNISISDLYPCKNNFDLRENVYTLLLPWKRLRSLKLQSTVSLAQTVQIAVIYKRRNYVKKVWRYVAEIETFVKTKYESIKSLRRPLILLESEYVQNVYAR